MTTLVFISKPKVQSSTPTRTVCMVVSSLRLQLNIADCLLLRDCNRFRATIKLPGRSRSANYSCQGGFPDQAFNYWKGTGLPTEQCEKYVPSFGSCTKRCDTTTPLHSDDVRLGTDMCAIYLRGHAYIFPGSSSYRIKNDVKEIQREIMKFGPVECAFDVSQDFMNYKSGTYGTVTNFSSSL